MHPWHIVNKLVYIGTNLETDMLVYVCKSKPLRLELMQVRG